jgi:hypothetical protein
MTLKFRVLTFTQKWSCSCSGEEPAGRVTAVEHEEVILAEFVEVFERHLALADVGGVKPGGQGHFDPGPIKREAFGLDPVADGAFAVMALAEQGQVQVDGIIGDDAQSVPEGKAELRIDQGEEMVVEQREGSGRYLLPGFGKGRRGDSSRQICTVRQVFEQGVQFRLHFGRVSTEQAGNEAGKTEDACSGEGLLRQTRLNEKSLRKKEVRERVSDVDTKISAYKILSLYQRDRFFAGRLPDAQPGFRHADKCMLLARYVESIAL